MSATAAPAKPRTRKPKTAAQQRAEQGVIDVRIVGFQIPAAQPADGNGSDAGGNPPRSPAPRRTGGGRRPLPPWQRFLLWAGVFLLAYLIGAMIGQFGVAIEKSLERVRGSGEA